MTAADRYGRRGGRWLPSRPADVAAVEAWREQRDALEAAATRSAEIAGEQLALDALLEVDH